MKITRGHRQHLQSRLVANAPARCAGLLAAAISACYAPTVSAQEQLMLEEIIVTVRRRVEMEQDVPISMEIMDSDYLRVQNIVELNDLGTKVPAVRISDNGTSVNQPLITIRGQRPTDVNMALDQAAPLYFNEVVMTPSQGTNLSMYDLENIQVLKGPQGTLFGRNSTGGAIMITPKTPGLDFGGYAELEVGNYGLYSFEGAADLPVNDTVQFRVSTRVAQRDGYQDNVADNALGGKEEYWDEDSKGIRLRMNVSLDRLTSLSTLSYDENELTPRLVKLQAYNGSALGAQVVDAVHNGSLPAAFLPGYPSENSIDNAVAAQQGYDAHEIPTDVAGEEKVENTFFANITEFFLTDSLTIKNVFGYRKVDFSNATDSDGTALPLIGTVTSTTQPITTDVSGGRSLSEAEQFSNELQLVGDAFDYKLDYIVGAYWFLMDGTQKDTTQQAGANLNWPDGGIPLLAGNPDARRIDVAGRFGLPQVTPYGDVTNEALGLFGEGTYSFNEQWSATLGLRYSYDEREVTVKNRQLDIDATSSSGERVFRCEVLDENGNQLPLSSCARTESEEFSAPTWRASLNYTPTDGNLIYGSISTGYRAGGFNLRGIDNRTLEPFDEETVITYEFGHKADWGLMGHGPIRTNFAAYYQEYSDIQKTQQIQTPDGSFGTQVVNAAEAVIAGAEFDITWAVTAELVLSMGYAYTDSWYDEWETLQLGFDNAGDAALYTLDAKEGDFTYVPRNTATVSATYTLPIDPELGEMSFNVNGYWQDEMATHAFGPYMERISEEQGGWDPEDLALVKDNVEAEGYDVWNLRYDWRNVMESDFDVAAYVNNVTDEEYVLGGLNVIDILGISAATFGPPRTYGVSLRYQF